MKIKGISFIRHFKQNRRKSKIRQGLVQRRYGLSKFESFMYVKFPGIGR